MKKIFHVNEAFENHEEIILRDFLALERTRMANERTLFSYIRTSLYLLTVGVGIFEIKAIEHLAALGWLCLVSGGILFLFGLYKYIMFKKQLKTYFPKQKSIES
ncbi:MAG TPA: DUF202 domain-containing protein [Dysgonomonas sp.]|nr:DUF202 domain-containing protein [Dysgonomonas sp.]